MAETTSLLPTSEVQGECRAELARALLSRRLHSQFHIAKLQKIIEKTKHFPDYFLTKKRVTLSPDPGDPHGLTRKSPVNQIGGAL